MKLDKQLAILDEWIDKLPRIGMEVMVRDNNSMYVLDFIIIGAIKRSLSLATGLRTLVNSKNMTCVRAMIRMQLDTVSRLLAYTYVSNPSEVAKEVLGGKPLNTFKCKEGKQLRDAYLIQRMESEYPWVNDVYKYTSGYVHFSERQIFDSIFSLGDDTERTVTFAVGKTDENFPKSSWIEAVQCFNEMLSILDKLLTTYKFELKQHI